MYTVIKIFAINSFLSVLCPGWGSNPQLLNSKRQARYQLRQRAKPAGKDSNNPGHSQNTLLQFLFTRSHICNLCYIIITPPSSGSKLTYQESCFQFLSLHICTLKFPLLKACLDKVVCRSKVKTRGESLPEAGVKNFAEILLQGSAGMV